MTPSLDVALKSLVAAYSVIFAGVFVFVWLMFGRQKKLEKKLDQLREDLRDMDSHPLPQEESGPKGRVRG